MREEGGSKEGGRERERREGVGEQRENIKNSSFKNIKNPSFKNIENTSFKNIENPSFKI